MTQGRNALYSGQAAENPAELYKATLSDKAYLMGDPHLHLPNGRRADFRGQPETATNLLSAPNVSVAAWVSASVFRQKGGTQLVHGTHFTKVRMAAALP